MRKLRLGRPRGSWSGIRRSFLLLRGILMDMIQGLTDFISSVGFPIAMCAALFYYVNKLDERHYQELSQLKETIGQNTEMLKELKLLISAFIEKDSK